MTELVQCERCDDQWLKEVQEEIRSGNLSKDNHNFLHGKPTIVPGSWQRGDVACGKDSCRKLATKYLNETLYEACHPKKRRIGTDPDYILKHECEICKKERDSKWRVARKAEDFANEPFDTAPAVFANNDVKYDANKSRAQKYANDKKKAVTYVSAKDTPSLEALREKPGLVAEKLSWLQRHDKESGDLSE